MKKIFTSILLTLSACLYADDVQDLIDLNNLEDLAETIDNYVELRTFQLETQPKFFKSTVSYRNTHMWYLWKEYDKASNFNKIKLGEQIEKLNQFIYQK